MKPHGIQQGSRAKARQLPRSLIQSLRSEASLKNPWKNQTLCKPFFTRRGFDSRFFGASPVASALDLRTGRDPDAKKLKISRSARWTVDLFVFSNQVSLPRCRQAE